MDFLPLDYLSVCLLLFSAILLFFNRRRKEVCGFYSLLNLSFVALIVVSNFFDSSQLSLVFKLYPLVLILLLYIEVDLIVENIYEKPFCFDSKVENWNCDFFGKNYYNRFSAFFSNRFWKELFHFLYFSYYLLLVGSFIAFALWWPDLFPRFAFIAVGIFASFMLSFILFPVAGPLSKSGVKLVREGLFPKLVYWAYQPVISNGINSGAFPSSHVGMSVGLAFLISPEVFWFCFALYFLVFGIALSTVYGRFHYAIDAFVGFLAGFLFYYFWSFLYSIF